MDWRERLARALAKSVVWCADEEWEDLGRASREMMLKHADAILSTIDAAGCAIAPKEATEEMILAHPDLVVLGKDRNVEQIHDAYSAMIAARPK